MAMNATTLADDIVTDVIDELYGGGGSLTAAQISGIQTIAFIIAQRVVYHITNHAVVTVASGIPVSTTGTASAQTGATDKTGTGTIA